jgi:GDP-4-dehydro-6-deoxy-D-mannose reductase
MSVLVTGLSGFVGRHLASVLDCVPMETQGHQVDLRSREDVLAAVQGVHPSAVIHLAAQSSVAYSLEHPRETLEVNLMGTLNLLEALASVGYRGRFLYIGSSDVYGPGTASGSPVDETCAQHPTSPYAVSKAAAEMLCVQWGAQASFDVVVARPFNHIGPGQSDAFVVSSLARQLVEIKMGKRAPVVEVGNVTSARDFTDVRDVVQAYALLLDHGAPGEAYNVCSGKATTVEEILLILMKLCGVEPEIRVTEQRLRLGDVPRIVGNAQKFSRATGWQPKIPLIASLADVLEDWERRLT